MSVQVWAVREGTRAKKSGWDEAAREMEMKVIGKETSPSVNRSTTPPACVRSSSAVGALPADTGALLSCATQSPTHKCPMDRKNPDPDYKNVRKICNFASQY